MGLADKVGAGFVALGLLIDAYEVFFPGKIAGMSKGKRTAVFGSGLVLILAGLVVIFLAPSETGSTVGEIKSQGNGNCIVGGQNNKVTCTGGGEQTSHPLDEVLPGLAYATVIKIDDNTSVGRKYDWNRETPEGATVTFYQSPSNDFRFTVTDIHQESYSLDIPIGSDGIELRKWVYLICEVGSGSNHSYLRVLADGKELSRKDLPLPLDLGSRQWGSGSIGGGQSFMFTEAVVWATTLSQGQIDALTLNAHQRFGFGQR